MLAAAALCFAVAYLFYNHWIVALVFSTLAFLYPRIRREELRTKRQQELSLQFKQALYSLASSLAAGRSLETSFREAAKDLQLLYPDPNTYMLRELDIINARMENGEPVERAVAEFSRRASVDDIASFSDVLIACKRTGGDLIEVVRRTSAMIGEKLEIQQEIAVLIAQKKFEANILLLVPFAFVALLRFSSPDYMAPLYEGVGYLITTSALLALALCYSLAKRLMNFKV